MEHLMNDAMRSAASWFFGANRLASRDSAAKLALSGHDPAPQRFRASWHSLLGCPSRVGRSTARPQGSLSRGTIHTWAARVARDAYGHGFDARGVTSQRPSTRVVTRNPPRASRPIGKTLSVTTLDAFSYANADEKTHSPRSSSRAVRRRHDSARRRARLHSRSSSSRRALWHRGIDGSNGDDDRDAASRASLCLRVAIARTSTASNQRSTI